MRRIKLSLKEVSLKDISKEGKGIASKKQRFNGKGRYLARIDNELYLGQFFKVWYGWSFDDGWGSSGHQFDPPGENSSGWQQLWEIIRE